MKHLLLLLTLTICRHLPLLLMMMMMITFRHLLQTMLLRTPHWLLGLFSDPNTLLFDPTLLAHFVYCLVPADHLIPQRPKIKRLKSRLRFAAQAVARMLSREFERRNFPLHPP
jgi:hypothetical protein